MDLEDLPVYGTLTAQEKCGHTVRKRDSETLQGNQKNQK